MDRRSVLIFGAGLVAMALNGSVAFGQAVTINFLHAQGPGTYDAVIADFEKQNPGIKVREQRVPFDQLNAQVQARIGAKDASIDVYGADEPRVPALADHGLLKDLSSLKDQAVEATAAKAVEATSWNGKLYALPEWTSTQLLFYNTDLLAKAGIEPPPADVTKRWTWAQLLSQSKKAQAAGAKWGFSFEQVDRYYQLQPLFESSGAGPGLTGEKLLTPDVAGDKWVTTMKWYGDIYADGIAPRGIPAEQIPSLFLNGQLAFMVAGPWNFASIEKAGVHFGIAPQPYFEGGKPVTPTDSWAVGISPYSKHADEAIKFASYISLNGAGALESSVNNPLPPANKVAFERNVEEQVRAGGEATAKYGEILSYELANTAVSRPRTTGYVIFEEVLNKAFSDVRNGAEAKARLEQAQKELQTNFARLH
jgi:ABC-type glycerol-3-phosphate transport system substrate-binding protein